MSESLTASAETPVKLTDQDDEDAMNGARGVFMAALYMMGLCAIITILFYIIFR